MERMHNTSVPLPLQALKEIKVPQIHPMFTNGFHVLPPLTLADHNQIPTDPPDCDTNYPLTMTHHLPADNLSTIGHHSSPESDSTDPDTSDTDECIEPITTQPTSSPCPTEPVNPASMFKIHQTTIVRVPNQQPDPPDPYDEYDFSYEEINAESAENDVGNLIIQTLVEDQSDQSHSSQFDQVEQTNETDANLIPNTNQGPYLNPMYQPMQMTIPPVNPHDQYDPMHTYTFEQEQSRTSPIYATPHGFPPNIGAGSYSQPNMPFINTDRYAQTPMSNAVLPSPYAAFVQAQQYQNPIQPFIIPPLMLKPYQRINQDPIWAVNRELTAYDAHRNVPLFFAILPTIHSKPDDRLTMHVTTTPFPRQGPLSLNCTTMSHKNIRSPGAPMHTEMAIDQYPWIKHLDEAKQGEIHYHQQSDFSNVTGVYLSFPCAFSCRHPRTTPPIWYVHIEGQYYGNPARQIIPVSVKFKVHIPIFIDAENRLNFDVTARHMYLISNIIRHERAGATLIMPQTIITNYHMMMITR